MLNGVGLGLRVSVDLDGTQTGAPLPGGLGKRPAYSDPAALREREDGQTKRLKTGENCEEQLVNSDGNGNAKEKVGAATHAVCSSCFDLFPKFDVLQLSCKDLGEFDAHAYCRECLQGLFEASVTDPSLFPPRCCSAIIPLFSCVPFLPKVTINRFVERKDELDTPNRTYCSNPSCARWVKPASIVANIAVCTHCLQRTCTTCKGKQHVGFCPEDEHVKELMSVAEKQRWKTCPWCKNMVELSRGCYHIT
jgi:hypothetical protein